MRVRAEGWRRVAHSYALVHQQQILAWLRLGVAVDAVDLPFYKPFDGWRRDLLPAEDEAELARLDGTASGEPDAVFRITYPYDLRPAEVPTFVFATTEFRILEPQMLHRQSPGLGELDARVEIVTPSNWCRRGLLESGAPEGRVHVVPHGVDLRLFRPPGQVRRKECRAHFGVDGRFVFLNLGALTSNKGLLPLLQAFARVARAEPRAVLVFKGLDELYGSAKMLDDVRHYLSEAERSVLRGRIRYFGGTWALAEVARLYQAADCYVSPYLAEGFNLPVLEAAACGLPVVCTAGGPTDDFVTDTFALRVPSTELRGERSRTILRIDLPGLIQAMQRTLQDEAWRAAAAPAAAAHVREHYSWDRVGRALLELFRRRASDGSGVESVR